MQLCGIALLLLLLLRRRRQQQRVGHVDLPRLLTRVYLHAPCPTIPLAQLPRVPASASTQICSLGFEAFGLMRAL